MKDLIIMRASQEITRWPLVSIIVLNWDQPDLTLACLDTLAGIDYAPFEIIVVDNGSSDGSPAIIRDRYPDVRLIENGINLGFSEGNNIGIRDALSRRADYILLLNNDTVVDPGFLKALIQVAESDSQIGVVTPKIYYFNNPTKIWCAGAQIDWETGETYRLRAEEKDNSESDNEFPQDVKFVSGCAMCIKRSVIEKVGFLDPRYFAYYEEVDWCVRITRKNYRCVYVPKSKIWHIVSASIGVDSPLASYYMTRNQLLFLWNNAPGIRRYQLTIRSLLNDFRTISAYSMKKKYRKQRKNQNAMFWALRDALLGRYGEVDPLVKARFR